MTVGDNTELSTFMGLVVSIYIQCSSLWLPVHSLFSPRWLRDNVSLTQAGPTCSGCRGSHLSSTPNAGFKTRPACCTVNTKPSYITVVGPVHFEFPIVAYHITFDASLRGLFIIAQLVQSSTIAKHNSYILISISDYLVCWSTRCFLHPSIQKWKERLRATNDISFFQHFLNISKVSY